MPETLRLIGDDTFGYEVDRLGIEQAQPAEVLSLTKDAIVIKQPRHKYWAGKYMDRAYAPPEILVYRILEWKPDRMLTVQHVISWETKRQRDPIKMPQFD